LTIVIGNASITVLKTQQMSQIISIVSRIVHALFLNNIKLTMD